MNQNGAAAFIFLIVVGLIGAVVAYDIIKNDRLDIGINGPKENWQWEDDWNNPHAQPQPQQPGNPPQPQQPQQPQKPQPPMNQITATSYEDAVAKSGEYGMPVLAVFGADWCGWCTKLKNETLTDENVKAVMMNYIVVHVNVDQNRNVSRKFGVSGIPAYVITNSEEKNLKKGAGYKNASQFASWLNNPEMFKQPKK